MQYLHTEFNGLLDAIKTLFYNLTGNLANTVVYILKLAGNHMLELLAMMLQLVVVGVRTGADLCALVVALVRVSFALLYLVM